VAITMAVKEAGTTAEGSGGFGGVVPPGGSRVRPTARERLLAAANELFYNEGVHTVGIDRVIEQAGVAKASLYNTFGSKDELVRAYLETRHASVTQRITQAVERYDTPRERLLAVFEGQGELFAQPDYRGCAFARASAESHPGDLAEQAAEDYRRWVRTLLTELAAQAGVPEPEVLARQLHLLYDGSGQSARMDHDPAAAVAARTAAATLLDAARGPAGPRPGPARPGPVSDQAGTRSISGWRGRTPTLSPVRRLPRGRFPRTC
jgi:AcrR family transcriptional regulator